MIDFFSSLTSFTKFIVRQVVQEGESVIDATAGNGHDTLFLAELVGNTGTVYAFDVQKEALENTYLLVKQHGLEKRVSLFNCSHEYLNEKVNTQVKTVMFNLGYLPGSNHKVITKPITTIKAVSQAMDLLTEKGLITINVYAGHEGGKEEKSALEDFLKNVDKRNWDVLRWSFLNRKEDAPCLILLSRRR